MDIKKESVREYLEEGKSYRELSKKYGVSRTTINKWVFNPGCVFSMPCLEAKQDKDDTIKKKFANLEEQ